MVFVLCLLLFCKITIVSSTLKDSYNKKGLLNINFASSLTFAFLFFFPFVAYACHHDITFCLSTFIYIAQWLGPANVYNIIHFKG